MEPALVSQHGRVPVIRRATTRSRTKKLGMPGDGRTRDEKYIDWLRETRGLTRKEAERYATTGTTEEPTERSRTVRERTVARENDKGEQLRRWERVDRPCPLRDCILPIHHSGPHRRHAADFERADSLDEFEARLADDPGPEISMGDGRGIEADPSLC